MADLQTRIDIAAPGTVFSNLAAITLNGSMTYADSVGTILGDSGIFLRFGWVNGVVILRKTGKISGGSGSGNPYGDTDHQMDVTMINLGANEVGMMTFYRTTRHCRL